MPTPEKTPDPKLVDPIPVEPADTTPSSRPHAAPTPAPKASATPDEPFFRNPFSTPEVADPKDGEPTPASMSMTKAELLERVQDLEAKLKKAELLERIEVLEGGASPQSMDETPASQPGSRRTIEALLADPSFDPDGLVRSKLAALSASGGGDQLAPADLVDDDGKPVASA